MKKFISHLYLHNSARHSVCNVIYNVKSYLLHTSLFHKIYTRKVNVTFMESETLNFFTLLKYSRTDHDILELHDFARVIYCFRNTYIKYFQEIANHDTYH